jgi:DNA replication and repair protein RecF
MSQIEAEAALATLEKDEYTASVDPSMLRGRIPHLEMHTARIAEEFKRQLEEMRSHEVRRGVSLLGPHRDDLLFQLGDPSTGAGHILALGAYGSRGQQRTAVLALKLAEVDLMTAETGDTPILLLDDILSELDARRRGYLLNTISGQRYQALITTTDLAGFDPKFLEGVELLEVRHGEVLSARPTL